MPTTGCGIGDRKRSFRSPRFYVTTSLMAISAVVLSGAVIVYFNQAFDRESFAHASSSIELAAVTLMPYMISAAVAAITAIGITTILPLMRVSGSLVVLQDRLAEMGCGDLASRIKVDGGSEQVRLLVRELNGATAGVANQIAGWKIINRRQWDLLETVRRAVAENDCREALSAVEQMQTNWEKIAAIEERLIT